MNPWIAYALGIATLPTLALAAGLVLLALERKSGWGPCEMCEAAGIRTTSWDIGERRNITAAPIRWWHLHVTARRPKHRRAWQAYWDERRGMRTMPSRTAQRRYGTAR